MDDDQLLALFLILLAAYEITREEEVPYYPPEEVFNSLHWLEPLGDFLEVYDRVWTEITSQ